VEEKLELLTRKWGSFSPKLFEPSHSACLESGRGAGGQHEAIRQAIDGEALVGGSSNELLAMIEVSPGVVEERRGWPIPDFSSVLAVAYDSESVAGPMCCKTVGICEPLKVRVITKGRALPYYVVHSVQKWMHENLRRMENFQLIGRPVDDQIMEKLMKLAGKDQKFISGDYTAATDYLKIEMTKIVFSSSSTS
jgi:hypothetical protein